MIEPAKKVAKHSRKKEKGRWGEQFATDILQQRGYTILAHNVHSRYGEIDIIAKDDNEIVFVEVKLRTNTAFGTPEESITKAKKQRILNTIWDYLDKTIALEQKETQNWRCDLFVIEMTEQTTVKRYAIYRNFIGG